MATVVEKENKDGSISIKAIVRYRGVFLTKTFPVKANRKKSVINEASDWARSIESQIDNGTYRKEEKKVNKSEIKDYEDKIRKLIDIDNPSRELIQALIDKIIIDKDRNIEIIYKFSILNN